MHWVHFKLLEVSVSDNFQWPSVWQQGGWWQINLMSPTASGSDSDKRGLWTTGRKPITADPELNLRRQNLHAHLSDASANCADYSLEVCLRYQGQGKNGFSTVRVMLFCFVLWNYFNIWELVTWRKMQKSSVDKRAAWQLLSAQHVWMHALNAGAVQRYYPSRASHNLMDNARRLSIFPLKWRLNKNRALIVYSSSKTIWSCNRWNVIKGTVCPNCCCSCCSASDPAASPSGHFCYKSLLIHNVKTLV